MLQRGAFAEQGSVRDEKDSRYFYEGKPKLIQRNSTREACCEVQLLAKLSHPHIIKMHEFFSDEEHLYIVMQYASKGDLHQILKRRRIRRDIYSEQELWSMAYQILSALEYLHARSVIHRDVKTLNIFVDAQSRLYVLLA